VSQQEHYVRRINRRTAFVVMCNLDRQNRTGLVTMMRDLVQNLGVDGAMKQCKFPPHIPQEAIEIQRLCCEYLKFEEGQPSEPELIEAQKAAQRKT